MKALANLHSSAEPREAFRGRNGSVKGTNY